LLSSFVGLLTRVCSATLSNGNTGCHERMPGMYDLLHVFVCVCDWQATLIRDPQSVSGELASPGLFGAVCTMQAYMRWRAAARLCQACAV
jgi:hypothetical protein